MTQHDEPEGAPPSPDDKPDADRRSADRRVGDRRRGEESVAVERRAGQERRTTNRRTRTGPNSYELDDEEMVFIRAINAFKERTGRPFPTWSEVLGILRELGYSKQ
jgi:hypothetical protein